MRTRRRISGLSRTAALIAGLVAATVTTFSQSDGQTFLAVVRQDGSLIPIAAYDGATWWNRWPWATESDKEVEALPIPPDLAAIPKEWLPPGMSLPSRWTLLTDDGRRVAIKATRPVKPSGFDQMLTVGIQSDYRDQAENQRSDEKGVAIAGEGELGSFRDAPRRESDRILRQLVRKLRAVEEVELARWLRERRYEVPGEEITLSPAARTAVGHADIEPFQLLMPSRSFKGLNYSYLTGEKLFSMGPKSGDCLVNLSFSGVVVSHRDGDIVSADISAHPYEGYCGGPADWMTPLATLVLDGRLWWVVRDSVEDGYDYDLHDPTRVRDASLKGDWRYRGNR